MSTEEIVFFRPGFLPSAELKLEGEEISHLKAFRVYSEEKAVIIKDGSGTNSYYSVPASSKSGSFLKSEKKEKPKQASCIATAIPKGNRLEWLIQKGTELGITKFIFLVFAHSDRKDLNPERLLKVAAEACAQSNQDFLPEILGPFSLQKFVESYSDPKDELLLLDPRSETKIDPNSIRNKTILIGPEGGFRSEELDFLRKSSVPGVNVGESILRIETAGIFAASLFRIGNWD
ncbi:16S rRNA (uracil(1498)-N(3))-methyltransferase [Leptospira langatensis]|uniref:Ribosomal RNA small subunit methyltransferase E n=1 Tax=Leptospira langatensis TaxID=2484983 RepID=A0A5F1ZP83_9LEPT|nr:16S rRNA (uracil(1498)-N(3))-methyltransferase [Leptospira langatensis]TGK05533.1 16S rRNA (uracil(1498)-N(3))-methyltransferase [Leptospira langatensis]TGL38668.1 16S rRNA (uracil(1498)-N(3))-methyltransferase [Leptospira langatensis]